MLKLSRGSVILFVTVVVLWLWVMITDHLR